MRLIAENLACIRGGRKLFDGLGFVLEPGQALAVTGPNGAGKSSLLRLIAGFLHPAEGRIALEGAPDDRAVGLSAHFVGHLDGVKTALSGAENLAFMRGLLGGSGQSDAAALSRLGLAAIADVPAGLYSAGQKRRLALARLVAVPRPLWLLDEPLTALDAEGQRTVAALARAHLAQGGIVVAATHAPLGIDGVRELNLGAAA